MLLINMRKILSAIVVLSHSCIQSLNINDPTNLRVFNDRIQLWHDNTVRSLIRKNYPDFLPSIRQLGCFTQKPFLQSKTLNAPLKTCHCQISLFITETESVECIESRYQNHRDMAQLKEVSLCSSINFAFHAPKRGYFSLSLQFNPCICLIFFFFSFPRIFICIFLF